MCRRGAGAQGRRGAGRFGLLLLTLFCASAPLRLCAQGTIQQRLQTGQQRLNSIREEREQLQREREALQGKVHEVEQELQNVEAQQRATNRIVNEIDRQLGALNNDLDNISASMALAEDNLADKRAALARRLVDIYKRGNLYYFQALLAAESFGDLISRYKYLALQSRQDKALTTELEALRNRVVRQRRDLVDARDALARRRAERDVELNRYSSLAEEQRARLRETRRTARSTDQRLTALQQDEARLNDLLVTLERERRAEAARVAAAAAAAANRTGSRAVPPPRNSVSTADIGRLDWPVQGGLVYRFGTDEAEGGGTIRHNGVAIRAEPNTPVKVVEAGRVIHVGLLGTYGLMVIVSHGGGYMSLYGQLTAASVEKGADVVKGQVIGTTGGANTPEGPHLYLEIRGAAGEALDPSDWLRTRR
ncbi:MAG TPA: peptidoglycan DD-metalloendopeptidase family protein [Gemmatimonadales bacterium]|nr:peptidoglycan DD-metalloendopeptidase family protein [Gemmatimonadales bacterium]